MSATPRCGRGEIGFLALAEGADHCPHLLQCPRRLLLDHTESLERGGGIGRGDDASGLGADDDRRDMMGDRVMELACQLLALDQLDLIHPAPTGVVLVADRGADRCGEQHHEHPGDSLPTGMGSNAMSATGMNTTDMPIATSRPAPQRRSA